MRTLADLKREAASGKIRFEMVERYGETGDAIPERCRGIRTVEKVNTVAILLKTADGIISELRFDSAKLVEYDGKNLTIFERGERELTEQEKTILTSWEHIQAEYLEKNPWGDTFWKKKEYFKNSPCPWLAGFETVRGKRYNNYNGKIIDNQVRGNVILKYRIYH